MASLKTKNISRLVLLFFLVSAILTRFYQLKERFGFDWDQERDAFVAWNIIKNHDLVFIGPKVGPSDFFLGPFYHYLQLPFYYFSNLDPIGAAISASFIGVITIFAIFFVGTKLFSKEIGLISALIWTFSYLLIGIDRTAWNLNPLPLLLIVYIFVLNKIQNQQKLFIILAIIFGILIQLHFSAVYLFFITIAFFLIFKIKIHGNIFILGFLGFIAVNQPIILFEIKNNFLNSKIILDFLIKGHNPNNLSFGLNIFRVLQIFYDLFNNILWPNNVPIFVSLWSLIFLIIPFFVYRNKLSLFLYIWILIPILGYFFYRGDIFPPYYFLITILPIIFLISSGILYIYKKGFFGKVFVYLFFAIFLIINMYSFVSYKSDLSYSNKEEAIKFILKKVGGRPLFLSYSTKLGYNSGYDYLLKYYGKESIDVPSVYHFSIVVPQDFEKGEKEWIFGDIKVIQRSEGLND